MSTINAYIQFKNNCRQAMSFYQECLGGKLTIQVVKDSPMKNMFPPQLQDIVLHSSLENGNLTLLASEMPMEGADGQMVTLMLNCDSKKELLSTFEKLSAGGNVVHPIEEFFAGTMGNIIDKFGVRWGVFTAEKS
jgi:PhnB protein